MKVIDTFPHQTAVRDPVFITLSDGVRLAARIWLPGDAERNPVPAILEYLPYRRRDGTADRDALTHPYFAGHGYACVRVDMRGAGDSDGVLLGEYLKQEQDDALEIIDWITAQPWCSGTVGMIRICSRWDCCSLYSLCRDSYSLSSAGLGSKTIFPSKASRAMRPAW